MLSYAPVQKPEAKYAGPLPASLPQTIYMVAIAGTGMAALAAMLIERGHTVIGSDKAAYPPTGPMLEDMGAQLRMPFGARNIPDDLGFAVIGNAVGRDHEEVQALQQLNVPYLSMAETIEQYFAPGSQVFVAAGTHGKTTTSAMAAHMLQELGRSPSYFIGGQTEGFSRPGGAPPDSKYLVLEGDEYSTSFYDFGPKFWHYPADAIAMPSLEFDHADLYPDDPSYLSVFAQWLEQRTHAFLSCDASWSMTKDLLQFAQSELGWKESQIGCLNGSKPSIEIRDLRSHPGHSEFALVYRGTDMGTVQLPMFGQHNCTNAALAIVALAELGLPAEDLCKALSNFGGIQKRQTVLSTNESGGAVVFDFGHHPSEIAVTIQALQSQFPGRPIHAIFEPRSYSSRRKSHEAGYCTAFAAAQQVSLAPVFNSEAIPASERLDTARIALHYPRATAFTSIQELESELLEARAQHPEQVFLFFSNGSFEGLPQKIAALSK